MFIVSPGVRNSGPELYFSLALWMLFPEALFSEIFKFHVYLQYTHIRFSENPLLKFSGKQGGHLNLAAAFQNPLKVQIVVLADTVSKFMSLKNDK